MPHRYEFPEIMHHVLPSLWQVTVLNSQQSWSTFRTWTSTGGRKIEVGWVANAGPNVQIKMRDGPTLTLPLDRFTAEDQAFAAAQGRPSNLCAGSPPTAEKT